jgi:putative transposase
LDEYLSPFIEIYAWALIPNHFHLLVRIKNPIENRWLGTDVSSLLELKSAFRRFFQSYAQSINIQEGRKGPLFESAFKRKLIDSPEYFTQLIYYIHSNPQIHGMVEDFRTYPWTSFNSFLNPRPSKLNKSQVLKWFGGLEKFEQYHSELREFTNPRLKIEDEENLNWTNRRR